MPQICKQAFERPICMLLGERLGNSTVPFGVHSTLWWLLSRLNWEWPTVSIITIMSSVSCWHKKDIMVKKSNFSAIQDGVSARVHAVSICASKFLTITQASFQQMLLLTSIAWHQVRNSEREPNCLKAIGCSYSETVLCCTNLYVLFLPILDLQLTVTWKQITLS